MKTYTILKDTREKLGWEFEASATFTGYEAFALKTGDYTIKEFKDILCVERKRNTAEIYNNIFTEKGDRFERELERMRDFKYSYIIFEFNMNEVINFPFGSGIPRFQQKYIRANGFALLKRLSELQIKYPYIQFVYAGAYGKEYLLSLFKRVVEKEEQCQKNL